MKKLRVGLIAAVVSMVAFTSCDKNVKNDGKEAGVTINMTDAPGDYAALNVEIERVDIYSESSGWITLSSEAQMVNVLELTNGAQTTLASSSELEAGLYTQVAVYFGSNNSIQAQADGQFVELDLGAESMIVIDIHEEISASSNTDILLDFNVAESVVLVNGVFTLDPEVDEIEDTETGIQGQVDTDVIAHVTLSNGSGSFSGYTNASGHFLIRGMGEGSYTLTIQAEDESAGGNGSVGGSLGIGVEIPGLLQGGVEGEGMLTVSYENVVIVEGEIRQMGTISLQ
ncbi:MAG: DUF4382 domain-containing protein [Flavobacteriales bacterium]|nr:DUF4382 domain-containing protein [Flavobacteriales bacterium]